MLNKPASFLQRILSKYSYAALTLSLLITMAWAQYHPIISFFVLLFIVALLLKLIVKIFKYWKDFHIRICSILSALAIVIWAIMLQGNLRRDWLAFILIEFNQKTYASCKTSGIIFDGNQRLAVCSVDDKWWRDELTKSIIYDSSGQIMLKQNQRSEGWVNAALALQRKAPFGIIGFSARRLTGDFYVANFTDSLPQNVTPN